MADGLSGHGAVHLETLTDHGGSNEPGLTKQGAPIGMLAWPDFGMTQGMTEIGGLISH